MSDINCLSLSSSTYVPDHSELGMTLDVWQSIESQPMSVAIGVIEASPTQPGQLVLHLNPDVSNQDVFKINLQSKIDSATREERAGAALIGWNAPRLALFMAGVRAIEAGTASLGLSETLLRDQVQSIIAQLATFHGDAHQLLGLFHLIESLSVTASIPASVLDELLSDYQATLRAFVQWQQHSDPQVLAANWDLFLELGVSVRVLSFIGAWHAMPLQSVTAAADLNVAVANPDASKGFSTIWAYWRKPNENSKNVA